MVPSLQNRLLKPVKTGLKLVLPGFKPCKNWSVLNRVKTGFKPGKTGVFPGFYRFTSEKNR